jgi:hypothetical protein
MTVEAPDRAARFAASTLVSMPPRASALPTPPAMASSAGSPARPSLSNVASGFLRGSAVYNPDWSVSRTSTSASIRFATSAPSVSLSPTRISSVVTVSFSFTTGITPSASSVRRVVRALR